MFWTIVGALLFISIGIPIILAIIGGGVGLASDIVSDSVNNNNKSQKLQSMLGRTDIQLNDKLNYHMDDEDFLEIVNNYSAYIENLINETDKSDPYNFKITNTKKEFFNFCNLSHCIDVFENSVNRYSIKGELQPIFERVIGKNAVKVSDNKPIERVIELTDKIKIEISNQKTGYNYGSEENDDYYEITVYEEQNPVLKFSTNYKSPHIFKPNLWILKLGKVSEELERAIEEHNDIERKKRLREENLS